MPAHFQIARIALLKIDRHGFARGLANSLLRKTIAHTSISQFAEMFAFRKAEIRSSICVRASVSTKLCSSPWYKTSSLGKFTERSLASILRE